MHTLQRFWLLIALTWLPGSVFATSGTTQSFSADTTRLVHVSAAKAVLLVDDAIFSAMQSTQTRGWKKRTTVSTLDGKHTMSPSLSQLRFKGHTYLPVTTDLVDDSKSFDVYETVILQFSDKNPVKPKLVRAHSGTDTGLYFTGLMKYDATLFATTSDGTIEFTRDADVWQTITPTGLPEGMISDAASNKDGLYVLVDGVIYTSQDGQSWTAVSGTYSTQAAVVSMTAKGHDLLVVTQNAAGKSSVWQQENGGDFERILSNQQRVDLVTWGGADLYVVTRGTSARTFTVHKRSAGDTDFTEVLNGKGVVQDATLVDSTMMFVARSNGKNHLVVLE